MSDSNDPKIPLSALFDKVVWSLIVAIAGFAIRQIIMLNDSVQDTSRTIAVIETKIQMLEDSNKELRQDMEVLKYNRRR